MNTELQYLVWVTALTGVLWIPYVLDRFFIWGIRDTVGYPENPRPQTLWARRLMSAHDNAIENLVIFAVLVLVANSIGLSNSVTAGACVVYFWARVAHLAAYIFAIPWARTLAFTAGFAAQVAIAWQLFVS
ncbi:MAG: hypothetical protein AMXMBFR37_10260 [Steroidobacteraceae bacterium]